MWRKNKQILEALGAFIIPYEKLSCKILANFVWLHARLLKNCIVIQLKFAFCLKLVSWAAVEGGFCGGVQK